MAFSASGLQAAVIANPALGGVTYVAGAALVFATCVFLFVLGVMLTLFIRYERAPTPYSRLTIKSLAAAVGFIVNHNLVLHAVTLNPFTLLLGGATTLLPIFVKDVLLVGAWGLGMLRSAPAVALLWLRLFPSLATRYELQTLQADPPSSRS